MRVIVAGAVDWEDEEMIRRELRLLPPGSVIIHGDCSGADEIAGRLAREEFQLLVEPGFKTEEDRRRYGSLAWKGLNERMVAQGVDRILAFHDHILTPGKARGTRHLLGLVQGSAVEIRCFTREGCVDAPFLGLIGE